MLPQSATVRNFLIAVAMLVAIGLVLPTPASARLFTVYDGSTIGAPVPIVDTRPGCAPNCVSGFINPVYDISGSFGLTHGYIDLVNQDFLIFDVTLSAGSALIDEITVTALIEGAPPFFEPVGAGVFIDAGDQAPDFVFADPFLPGSGTGIFRFSKGVAGPGNLEAGETSVRMFVTFNGLLLEHTTASFMISSGTNFTVQTEIIPEPGTLMLLGAGLAALGAGRWHRRKRAD